MNATTDIRSQANRERLIERATHRALEQARAGNLPTLLRQHQERDATTQVWSLGSRTTGGTVYLIDLTADADGLTTHCSCAAGNDDRVCWHRAACRLAALGEIDHHDGRRPVAHLARLAITSEDLMGGRR